MARRPLASSLADRLGATGAPDGPAEAVAKQIRNLIPAGPVKDALSGVWIGHALHPLLTDVPIGTWTSALLLDVLGGRESETAARRLIGAGLAATGPTLITGWNDWADAEPADDAVRRAGIVHASFNGGAVGLMAPGLVRRRAGGA